MRNADVRKEAARQREAADAVIKSGVSCFNACATRLMSRQLERDFGASTCCF